MTLQEPAGAGGPQASLSRAGGPASLRVMGGASHSTTKSTLRWIQPAPSTGDGSKWDSTVQALVNSYGQMDSTLAVGESFFPNARGGCVDQSGGVPIAPLTADQVAALQAGVQAIPNRTDIVGTPTHDAWIEGMRRLEATLASPPAGYETAKGYIVLTTDGMPVKTLDCGESDGDNIAVTEEQFNELIDDVTATTTSTGIQTFVIGVPGSENTNQVPSDDDGTIDYLPRVRLSELAVAGQTARNGCTNEGPYYCHLDRVEEPDFVTALETAVGTVLSAIMACNFTVPPIDIPKVFLDPDKVDVNYYGIPQ